MSRFLTAAVAANVLLLTVTLGPAAAAAPAWTVAPPVPLEKDATGSVLRDVSVVSPNDLWAIGSWTDGLNHTLAVHWDGATWTRVPTPDSADRFSEYALNAVDAVASNDVWAVGGVHIVDNFAKVTPLLLHFDGTAWTEAPEPSELDGELTDVDLLTADDGWAVGANVGLPFILHRTGGDWASVPVPPLAGAASLESVFAISPNDAWAVGFQQVRTRQIALVLHWDGSLWSQVVIPALPPGNTGLINVTASSASDVWAVGSQCPESSCFPWVLHLAGAAWRTEPTAAGAVLTAAVAFSPTDVWIFGQAAAPSLILDHVEHWDGGRFTTDLGVPPATVDPHHSASALSLAAASGDSQTHSVWAVGWIQGIQKSTHAIYRN